MHLIQGNHDYKTSLLANFGANDTEDYGVFVINEENFPSKQASLNAKNIVLNTANALDSYLAKKTSEEYIKPIFIVSHVPLHFSTRTQEDSDNIYAKYIFDACNKYGEDLNLIFLYGHNHAHGDDNYMGGASQFLKYDDSIYIAQLGSNTQYTDEKIDFIYMNAGYIGYY
ncbi:MAG: hypothetical protein MJ231_07940 [bacterium]|nr:hypothetical protein [bacterium]